MRKPDKPGRNDPCWCGSGKKYKRCHNDADRTARPAEPVETPVHRDLITASLVAIHSRIHDYGARAMAPADTLRDDVLTRIGDGLAGRDAAFALRDYIAALEEAMRPLLAGHSRFFWLQLARRWPPNPIGDSTVWTTTLYRRIFILAVLKHGSAPTNDELVQFSAGDATQIVPATITDQDVLDLAAVEYLAYELNHAASAFRRVGKGAELRVVDGDLRALADAELQSLITSLDSRVTQYGSLSGPYGASVDTDLPTDDAEGGDTPLVALDLVVNAGRNAADALAGFAKVRFERPTNYVPHPIGLDAVREALVRFEADMTALIGVSPDALLATIHGLSIHTLTAMRQDARIAAQLFATGYLPFSYGEHYDGICKNVGRWVQYWWTAKRGDTIDHDDATQIAREAFTALTYSADDLASIDLWTRSPFRLLIAEDDKVVFDYSAIGEVLSGLFARVGFIPNDPDRVKGTAFETEVIRLAGRHGFATWRTGGITGEDGTKREIDASFIVGDTLFLIECKAFSQNPRIEQGDFAALQDRWRTLDTKYLNQARTLKEFIEQRRADRHVAVPAEVIRFEYAVCSPAVEWIPNRSAELWLTDIIPRICTPAELIEVMASRRPPD
jgi:hypothetical protein